jgi:NO-binding membrane sensor protein with MHYT domain
MPHQTLVDLATHQMLVLVAGSVCLFGTWVGMRHFARARATEGSTRHGWLFMASVGTGAALWASTFISILALDPSLNSGFDLVPTAGTLIIAIISCLVGFEIGSKPKPAPEIGLVMGAGILAMHYLGLKAWHINGTTQWNGYGVAITFVLGLGLGALSVNRANRPVTRWCRHGAAITLAFMICVMHYTLTASAAAIPRHLGGAVCGFDPGENARRRRGRRGAAGDGQRVLVLHHRSARARRIGETHPSTLL